MEEGEGGEGGLGKEVELRSGGEGGQNGRIIEKGR